jgi:hypothetical protein
VRIQEGRSVAKPNYSFEKRQRELAKKKKKEQKEKDKADRKLGVPGDGASATGEAGAANQPPNDPAMGPTGG